MENILKHLKWTNNVNLPYIFLSRSLKKDKKMLLETGMFAPFDEKATMLLFYKNKLWYPAYFVKMTKTNKVVLQRAYGKFVKKASRKNLTVPICDVLQLVGNEPHHQPLGEPLPRVEPPPPVESLPCAEPPPSKRFIPVEPSPPLKRFIADEPPLLVEPSPPAKRFIPDEPSFHRPSAFESRKDSMIKRPFERFSSSGFQFFTMSRTTYCW